VKLLFYVPQMAAYGGMERHVCVLAQEACRRGHAVRLLTTSNSLNAGARAELRAAGVDFRELGVKREQASQTQKYLWLAAQTARAAIQCWDVIYTNGQSALARVVWRAARARTRIVHHHHTAADPVEQASWSAGFRDVLHRAPELVACSEATRNHIVTATSRQNVRYLPYFTLSPVNAEQVEEKRYRPDQPLDFGFVGRLVASKGIQTLCALSRQPELANITWHLHGGGPDFPQEFFSAYPRIRYHGPYQGPAAYATILLGLDALALFSQHNEGMPLSLLEATSAGLPWIATDRGGTREIALSADNCILVPPPADLDHALSHTIELARRLRAGQTSRRSQRAIYDAHFAPPVVAKAWFDYLEAPSHG
jgi:glycosyltransferase involved in cell wall biosynthesis